MRLIGHQQLPLFPDTFCILCFYRGNPHTIGMFGKRRSNTLIISANNIGNMGYRTDQFFSLVVINTTIIWCRSCMTKPPSHGPVVKISTDTALMLIDLFTKFVEVFSLVRRSDILEWLTTQISVEESLGNTIKISVELIF